VQRPVYFISIVLRDARLRYTQVQKLLLGVLLASRKLRHYFELHCITVVNSYSLGRVLHNRSATGCIAEWSIELPGFNPHFAAATAIKSQAMVDFVAKWTEVPIQEEEPHSFHPRKEDPKCWVIYFDGAFSIKGAGAGVLLVSRTLDHLKCMIQLASPARMPATILQNMKACLLVFEPRQGWASPA
jgi:hypothetical protein